MENRRVASTITLSGNRDEDQHEVWNWPRRCRPGKIQLPLLGRLRPPLTGQELWAETGIYNPTLPAAERDDRTLDLLSEKEQCVHRQRFESLAHASRAIGDWIQFYNTKRPHKALAMRTPNEAFNLAA
ncbi:integrase core domain-containing protein [Palleronia caenipelagi]|uniref:integrase core domain-containing protein n=1 Tax=Palleronia caenipelagi TaxID=2489174 RepID=UPI001C8F41C6|nr:integrase core domain-containing protein [Palleronia caenipelagi]